MPAHDRKSSFSRTLTHERQELDARDSLQQIVAFQHSLDREIRRLEHSGPQNSQAENGLLEKMMQVKAHYQGVRSGFAGKDDSVLRHAFAAYGDALQDLFTDMYRKESGLMNGEFEKFVHQARNTWSKVRQFGEKEKYPAERAVVEVINEGPESSSMPRGKKNQPASRF